MINQLDIYSKIKKRRLGGETNRNEKYINCDSKSIGSGYDVLGHRNSRTEFV